MEGTELFMENAEVFIDSLNKLCKKHDINLLASIVDGTPRIRVIEEDNDSYVDILKLNKDQQGYFLI